jgi:DNA-binding transcriptional MerR regulator
MTELGEAESGGPGPPRKAEGAFRTIGEVSRETGLPQHILRFWETRFTQLRPLQRAGNRRYYRPEDAVLVRRIDTLLNHEGYTIRGVQQLLAAEAKRSGEPALAAPSPVVPRAELVTMHLQSIRDLLANALATDAA